MAKYEQTVIIECPVEDVFAYMTDIDREAEWQPAIREASQKPEGSPREGTVRRYVSEFMGRRFTNVYRNTAFEPNRRIAYESTPESDVQATGEIEWESATTGTRVTMRVEPRLSGFMRLLPAALRDQVFGGELRSALLRVKEKMEAQPSRRVGQ